MCGKLTMTETLGTTYGGWAVPAPIQSFLNQDSVVYSAGVGEDISFDLNLQCKTGCQIYLIDPTPKAKLHYEEVFLFYSENKSALPFTGSVQPDYMDNIKGLSINLEKLKFIPCGLWDSAAELKFYRQSHPDYVSQSLIQGMFGESYDLVQVDSLANMMRQNGDVRIDLLKLDIEGAEVKVLNSMLDAQILPKIICVEFDLFIKGKDEGSETQKTVERLAANNYKIISDSDLNVTFSLLH